MEFQAVFPVWDKLTKPQQDCLLGSQLLFFDLSVL